MNKKRGKYRKGIFFVVYRKKGKKVEYLVLKRRLHWKGWEFPKAGLKTWERGKRKEAVIRELKEEAGGCRIINIHDMKTRGKYEYDHKMADRPWIGQTYSLFAVEVRCAGKVKIDKKEHSDYKWLDFKKTLEKLTWPNQKKCLKIVNKKK
jgi:8-oxo-dGTP pyrophosphatase MutT (NUDIX family)